MDVRDAWKPTADGAQTTEGTRQQLPADRMRIVRWIATVWYFRVYVRTVD